MSEKMTENSAAKGAPGETDVKTGMWRRLLFPGAFAAVALLWGLSFVGTKIALKELGPVQILAMRWGIAALLYTALVLTKVIKVSYAGKPLRVLLPLIVSQPCMYALFETWGVKLTTASESSIIIASIPVVLVIMISLIYKEPMDARVIAAIIIGFAGVSVVLLFSPNFSADGHLLGYLLLGCAVLFGAVFSITSKKASKYFSAVEITYAMAVSGALFFGLISLAEGSFRQAAAALFSGGETTWALVYLGVGCSFVAYALFNFTLANMNAAIVSSINTSAINIVGVVAGIVVVGDAWGWYTVLGVLMTVVSIVIISNVPTK